MLSFQFASFSTQSLLKDQTSAGEPLPPRSPQGPRVRCREDRREEEEAMGGARGPERKRVEFAYNEMGQRQTFAFADAFLVTMAVVWGSMARCHCLSPPCAASALPRHLCLLPLTLLCPLHLHFVLLVFVVDVRSQFGYYSPHVVALTPSTVRNASPTTSCPSLLRSRSPRSPSTHPRPHRYESAIRLIRAWH